MKALHIYSLEILYIFKRKIWGEVLDPYAGAPFGLEIDGFQPSNFGKLRVNFQSIQQNW